MGRTSPESLYRFDRTSNAHRPFRVKPFCDGSTSCHASCRLTATQEGARFGGILAVQFMKARLHRADLRQGQAFVAQGPRPHPDARCAAAATQLLAASRPANALIAFQNTLSPKCITLYSTTRRPASTKALRARQNGLMAFHSVDHDRPRPPAHPLMQMRGSSRATRRASPACSAARHTRPTSL